MSSYILNIHMHLILIKTIKYSHFTRKETDYYYHYYYPIIAALYAQVSQILK